LPVFQKTEDSPIEKPPEQEQKAEIFSPPIKENTPIQKLG